jgi:hypothetical protein
MAPAFDALPDDVAALKAALVAEREKGLKAAAELAVANAKAAEDKALIAAQKLRIAKLERQVYVSGRSARRGSSSNCRWSSRSWRRAPQKTNSLRRRRSRRRPTCARSPAARPSATRSPSICRASASCSTRRRPANAAAAPGCASSARTSRVRSRIWRVMPASCKPTPTTATADYTCPTGSPGRSGRRRAGSMPASVLRHGRH